MHDMLAWAHQHVGGRLLCHVRVAPGMVPFDLARLLIQPVFLEQIICGGFPIPYYNGGSRYKSHSVRVDYVGLAKACF